MLRRSLVFWFPCGVVLVDLGLRDRRSVVDRRTFLGAGFLALVAAACQDESGNEDGGGLSGGGELEPVEDCDVSTRGGSSTESTSLTLDDFDTEGGCSMTRDDILGPYYICVQNYRQSIAEDRSGKAMRMGFRVVDSSCKAIPGAIVDVWHCDAEGYYSAFDADPDIPAGESEVKATSTRFCRGAQATNAMGIAEFMTIFPGWYAGRTTHIHVRVYLPDGRRFTTQTYFAESVRDQVYAESPYDLERSAEYPTNQEEGIPPEILMRVTGTSELTATIQLVV